MRYVEWYGECYMSMKTVNIALVDDENDVGFLYRALLKKQIKSQECELHFFNAAQKFLDYLEVGEKKDEILILITDINMPNIDGFTLLGIVEKQYPQLELYISSAYGSNEYKEKANTFNIKGFIEKPINLDRIRKIVQNKFVQINKN